MPGSYTHTTRTTGTTLTASIYNADHQNHIDNFIPSKMDDASTNLAAMQATSDPGELGSESLPTSMEGEIARLRHAIKELKTAANSNLTQWYQTPYGSSWVNVKSYGATGDGSTDDYAACLLALADLASTGGTLYFPKGTYRLSHGLGIPYNNIRILGAGMGNTKLQALSGITSTAGLLGPGYDSSYVAASASNITIEDLSVDGNDLCWCVKGINITNAWITRVRSENSLRAPMQFYDSNYVTVAHCYLEDSNATDQFGDGLYFGGCVRPVALFNYIADFTRIGIVTEANGGTKSSAALIMGNFITNGHDNTVGEANAGIWCENTNSAEIIGNRITNLYNSPGTEKPRGITIGPGMSQEHSFFQVIGNHIEDVHYGITAGPADTTSTVLIEGNVVRAGTVHTTYLAGVHIGGGHNYIIKNNHFGAVTFDSGTNPGGTIFVDTVTDINRIHIENNQVDGITHYAASGDYRAFDLNGFTISNLRLINQTGKIAIGPLGHTNVYVIGCQLTGDSTSNRPISATGQCFVTNTSYTTTGGNATISAVSGAVYRFDNCTFPMVAFAYAVTDAARCNISFTDCYFGAGSYVEADGASYLTFDSCFMDEYRANGDGGFLKANFSNTTMHLRIRHCDFFHTSNEIPLVLWNHQPTTFLSSGNTVSSTSLGNLNRSTSGITAWGNSPVDVIATADLPAAGAAQDGRMVLEDAGAGDRNLIIYAGNERFRIDGGASV